MNISLVIVIIFGIIGYHLVCKPLAFLLHHIKKIVVNYFFNGFNVYEAYYTGLELGRIARIITKVIFFIITLIIAKIFIELYLFILN